MSVADKNNEEQQIHGDAISHSGVKLIARGLFELEARLKTDILNGMNPSYQKIFGELDVIQQSFGRIFNVLERHDTFLQDVVQKYAQLNTRIDKVMKEQEQMRKRTDVIERIISNPTSAMGVGGSPLGSHHNGGGARVGSAYGAVGSGGVGRNSYNNNRSAPRHAYGSRLQRPTHGGGGVVSDSSLPFHVAPPQPSFQSPQQQQQFSSTAKLWTRRGSGEFTSDEDSDDENEESDAIATTNENKVETIISSTTTVMKSETIKVAAGEIIIDDVATETAKKTLETIKEMKATPKIETLILGEEILQGLEAASEDDADPGSPADVKKTSATEVTNLMSTPPSPTPLSRLSVRGVDTTGNLTGGFGAFRRGKPAVTLAKTDDQKMPKTDSESNFDNPLSVRPLTTDELQVLSRAGRKTPPHFVTKPTSLFRDAAYSSSGFNAPFYGQDMSFSAYGRGGGANFGGNRGKKFSRH